MRYPPLFRSALLAALLTATTNAANILPNADFETEDPDGAVAPAEWTGTDEYMIRSDEFAHSGDWSMMIDNEFDNSFGQWKQIRPTEDQFEVEPGEDRIQSIWVYVDENEEPPEGTEVHLLTRWNGLVAQAQDVGFTLLDYPLNEWFQIEHEMVVAEFDAEGNDVTSATVRYYVNTNNDPDDLGGRIFLDDASWGPPGDDPVSILGDFDDNGLLDLTDINLLVAESASMNNGADFDVNSDGTVDGTDVSTWVVDLKKTWLGDSNLDGEFNSGDLVVVFQAGKFEVDEDANWAEGDWTGDGRFDTGDLVLAFQDGGFELGPRAAVSAVPEPTTYWLLASGLLLTIRRRRVR